MYINYDVLNITNGNTKVIDTEFGLMEIEKSAAGMLKIKTGKVIATDPILLYDDEGFSERINPGMYPVSIYVGKINNRKNQTVASELKINDNEVTRWEMALFKGESAKSFSHDEFMGYEVENGLGCFMDECVMEILDVMDEVQLESYEKSVKEAVRKSNSSFADILIDKSTGCNIIVFASGWNEGTFPTYYGFDKHNNVVRLVTDFMVVEK